MFVCIAYWHARLRFGVFDLMNAGCNRVVAVLVFRLLL